LAYLSCTVHFTEIEAESFLFEFVNENTGVQKFVKKDGTAPEYNFSFYFCYRVLKSFQKQFSLNSADVVHNKVNIDGAYTPYVHDINI